MEESYGSGIQRPRPPTQASLHGGSDRTISASSRPPPIKRGHSSVGSFRRTDRTHRASRLTRKPHSTYLDRPGDGTFAPMPEWVTTDMVTAITPMDGSEARPDVEVSADQLSGLAAKIR